LHACNLRFFGGWDEEDRIQVRKVQKEKDKKGNNLISTVATERQARDVTQVVHDNLSKCNTLRVIILHN
jgi:hypothetical protein